MQRKKRLAFVVIGAWALLVIVAFWYFQVKPLRLFDEFEQLTPYLGVHEQSVLANKITEIIGHDISSQKLVIVHFHSPECVCNKVSDEHIKEINDSYLNQNESVYLVTSMAANIEQVKKDYNVKEVVRVPSLSAIEWLPSLPAVAIFENATLAYFGPYSSGSFCGPSNSYVELVTKMLKQGTNLGLINNLELGCYCSNYGNSKS